MSNPLGIDVSHYQSTTPPLGGLAFLFARATIGTSPDDKYALHTTNARAAGLVVGAYHFGIGGGVPAQAAAFLAASGKADLLALDLENYASGPSMSNDEAQAFIAAVHASGHKIGLYHSESGYPVNLGQDWNWVAHWGTATPPAIPWTFWQYQGSPLDSDRFNGTQAQLLALAGKTPTPPPVQLWAVSIHWPTPVYADHSTSSRKIKMMFFVGLKATRSMVGGRWWYHITSARDARLVGGYVVADGHLTAVRI